jgi:hypothetical protein
MDELFFVLITQERKEMHIRLTAFASDQYHTREGASLLRLQDAHGCQQHTRKNLRYN